MKYQSIMIMSLLICFGNYSFGIKEWKSKYPPEVRENIVKFINDRNEKSIKQINETMPILIEKLGKDDNSAIKQTEWKIINLGKSVIVLNPLKKVIDGGNKLQSQRAKAILNLYENILAEDYEVKNKNESAKNILRENIKKRDGMLICISLFHKDLKIRIEAAKALGEIGDRRAVPCLVDAFENNILAMISMYEIFDYKLNESLLNSLEKLTGLSFKSKDISWTGPEYPHDMMDIINAYDKWWEENKEKINTE